MRELFFRLEIVFILIAAGLLLRMVAFRVLVGDDAVLGVRTSERFRPIADFVARTGGGR
jgi:hypothetical protein